MTEKINPEKLKTLQIIHSSLMAGVLFFGLFTMYSAVQWSTDMNWQHPLTLTALFITICSLYLSHLLFNKVISGVNHSDDNNSRWAKFQSAHLVKIAFLEIPAFFSIIAAFLTGIGFALFLAAFILIVMFYQFPTKDRVEQYL